MRERIKMAAPSKKELLPFLGSFGVALLSKIPLTAANTAGTLIVGEKLKDNPDLIALGIVAYALFNAASAYLDYLVLKRDRVSGSAKANTLYRGLTFVFPHSHKFNSVMAEIGTAAMNAIGINPDPTAPVSSIVSIMTGDPTIVIGQRVSDMAINLFSQVPYNIYLYARGNSRN